MTDDLKDIWAKVDARTGPQRMETEAEHIARDMREGNFPNRSDPIQVPVNQPSGMTDAPKRITVDWDEKPRSSKIGTALESDLGDHEYILATPEDAIAEVAKIRAERGEWKRLAIAGELTARHLTIVQTELAAANAREAGLLDAVRAGFAFAAPGEWLVVDIRRVVAAIEAALAQPSPARETGNDLRHRLRDQLT